MTNWHSFWRLAEAALKGWRTFAQAPGATRCSCTARDRGRVCNHDAPLHTVLDDARSQRRMNQNVPHAFHVRHLRGAEIHARTAGATCSCPHAPQRVKRQSQVSDDAAPWTLCPECLLQHMFMVYGHSLPKWSGT
eukprot:1160142-Pelagomonas_calceolata.AAC.3